MVKKRNVVKRKVPMFNLAISKPRKQSGGFMSNFKQSKVKSKSPMMNMNYKQAKRKFPKLSPFGDADKDGYPNVFDCKPLNKKRHMPTLYHVTTKTKVPKLKKDGIKYQKKPMFLGTYGQDLRKKGNVYAFKEKNDARRWATKTEWDKKEKVSVVTFDEPDNSERMKMDHNPQMQMMGRGSAVRIEGNVSPEQIQQVEDYDDDMRQDMMKENQKEMKEMEGKTRTIILEREDEE